MRQPAAWTMFIAALLAMSGNIHLVQADENPEVQYKETIAVLQMLYGIETRAHHRFDLFSKQAVTEGRHNTAHLFKAISISEEIHAKHFREILESLGIRIMAVDLSSIKATSTRENLKYAIKTELSEINHQYPRYIERIKSEDHKKALEYIHFAWDAEKHHRKLLGKIKSAPVRLISRLLSPLGIGNKHYYVNRNCGATVTQLPDSQCPVCRLPVETYLEVPRPK